MTTTTSKPWEPGAIYTPSRRTNLCIHCAQDEEAHQHHGLRAICPPPSPEQCVREANRLHEQGALVFDTAWLGANTEVVRIARECGLDPAADKRLALTLVRVAWEMCERGER